MTLEESQSEDSVDARKIVFGDPSDAGLKWMKMDVSSKFLLVENPKQSPLIFLQENLSILRTTMTVLLTHC